MARVELDVPYSQKDEAKRLGARWDRVAKRWFVPDGVDAGLFAKWLPSPARPNVKASRFYIMSSHRNCYRCGVRTPVFGLVIPALSSVIDDNGRDRIDFLTDREFEAWNNDEPGTEIWLQTPYSLILSYVTYISQSAAQIVRTHSPSWYDDFSNTSQSRYLFNHCMACDAKQGDFELIEELGGALMPTTVEAAAEIELFEHLAPIEVEAGHTSVNWLDHMRLHRAAR